MAEPDSATVDTTAPAAPPGVEVAASGGIITRTDGTAPAPDWRSSLPFELQNEPSLGKYKSVEDALKGAVHAQRLLGKAGEYPGADWKPEQVADYRKRAGVPEAPTKYSVTLPEPPAGSGMTWGPMLPGFYEAMHRAHARPEHVQAALDYYARYASGQWDQWRNRLASDEQKDLSESITALEQKWGPRDGPMWQHYQGRAEQAIRTLMADAPGDDVQRIVESANDPAVAHAFALLADSLLERGFLGAEELPAAMGAQDAQRRADELRDAAAKDPQHPLRNPRHPEHEKVYRQFMEYNAVAAGPRGREVVAEVRR